jgi:cytochrome c biogenesis protein CcmG/thiol:disulfide interchange protein DsbE
MSGESGPPVDRVSSNRGSVPDVVRRVVLVGIVVVFGLVGVMVSVWRSGDDSAAAAPDDPAPASDVSFVTFDGESMTLADLRGRPVVVNFWASWCPACIAEMPDFEAVHREFGDDVVFIGFAIQDDRRASEQLAEETGVTYTLVEDPPGDFFRAFDGIAMPTTVLLTAEGELAEKHSGLLTRDALSDKIGALLEDAAA